MIALLGVDLAMHVAPIMPRLGPAEPGMWTSPGYLQAYAVLGRRCLLSFRACAGPMLYPLLVMPIFDSGAPLAPLIMKWHAIP